MSFSNFVLLHMHIFTSVNRARVDQKGALEMMTTTTMTMTLPADPKEEKGRAAPRGTTMMPTTAAALDEVVEAVEVNDRPKGSW